MDVTENHRGYLYSTEYEYHHERKQNISILFDDFLNLIIEDIEAMYEYWNLQIDPDLIVKFDNKIILIPLTQPKYFEYHLFDFIYVLEKNDTGISLRILNPYFEDTPETKIAKEKFDDYVLHTINYFMESVRSDVERGAIDVAEESIGEFNDTINNMFSQEKKKKAREIFNKFVEELGI